MCTSFFYGFVGANLLYLGNGVIIYRVAEKYTSLRSVYFYPRGTLFLLVRNGAIHIVGSTGFVLYNTLLGSAFLCELRLFYHCFVCFCCYFAVCADFRGISLSAESDLGAPRP